MRQLWTKPLSGRKITLGARVLLVTIVACAVAAGGCKKKKNQAPPEERGNIFRDAGMSGPSDPRYGSQGAVTVDRPVTGGATTGGGEPGTTIQRKYKNCRKPTPVLKADPTTPQGTLYSVFEAILNPDEEAGFTKFYSLIDPDFQSERDARRYWFKQARLVDKKGVRPFLRLVYGEKNPSFDVCEVREEPPTAKRIFVGKSPPVGSNPPFVLHKVGDKWLIKSFTPF